MGNFISNWTLPIDGTSIRVKFEKNWFGEGAARWVYRGTYHGDSELEGERCVVKLYKRQWLKKQGEAAYKSDIRTSKKAKEMAQIFNRKHPTNRPLAFVVPTVSKIEKSAAFKFLGFRIHKKVKGKAGTKTRANMMIREGATVIIERFIDGKYTKFLNNSSYVNHSVVAHLPVAFSHFTFHESGGQILVCDLQGVRRNDSYVFTDPAIHSLNSEMGIYGPTDLGVLGMIKFFQNHKCNDICKGFIKPDFSKIPRSMVLEVNGILKEKCTTVYTHELQDISADRFTAIK